MGNSLTTMLSIRFLTGFFLAGIYPVGMKIAADYFNKGLGKSLGFSGRLGIRHCFPHLLKGITGAFPWNSYTHFFPCPSRRFNDSFLSA
jgi:MFS family permease